MVLALVLSGSGPSTSGIGEEDAGPSRRVRVLHAGDPSVENPIRVAWIPEAEQFLVSQGPAAVRLSFGGDHQGALVLADSVPDPEMAWDPAGGRLVVLDPGRRRVTAIEPEHAVADAGPMRWTDLPGIALGDVAGMAMDPDGGSLWILDAAGRRLIHVQPDPLAVQPEASWRRARSSVLPVEVPPGVALQGLAFEPDEGLLYTAAGAGRLLALDSAGRLVRSHDLTAAGVARPVRMVFAPSGDLTDDPLNRSLYILDGPHGAREHGHLVEVSLAQVQAPSAVTVVPSALVRTIETSAWSPPSPDPSGLAYDAARNRLLVVDGEVEEMNIWRNANHFESSLSGTLLASSNLTGFSIEPVGIAWVPSGLRRIISDDDARRVFVVTVGGDNLPGTPDDTVTSFSTTAFNSGDPEGVTLDAAGNRLFIADGVNAEVYEVRAGPNGVFDGVAPGGDDQVTHFDTASLGIIDPETVEYDSVAGTLYIIGSDGEQVLEMTTTGTVLRSIDTSSVPLDNPAGMVLAPGSADPGKRNLYVCDRKVDNDSNPNENDGRIYEIEIGATGGGGDGVRVAAGSDDAEEKPSGSISLTSSDLELVYDGAIQTVGMRFTGIDVPQGAAIGAAWIQFETDEAQSEATSLTLQGHDADNAATFTTTAFNVSSRPRTSAAVGWSPAPWTTAGDAGANQRTPDLSPIIQEIVDRPGWSAGNALAIVVTGTGRRTARAYDGKPAGAPLLHIELSSGPVNRAPVVEAGPDQTVRWPDPALLQGTVSDDHLPSPPDALTTVWSMASGPGTVDFDDPSALATTADFSVPGTYVLRLSADDGALSSADSLSVTVLDPDAPIVFERRVATGSDDAEQKVSSGKMSLTSSDIEFMYENALQVAGIRFTGVTVPPGVVIRDAWIQFKSDEVHSEATTVTIEGQASANPPGFTNTLWNISSRPTVAAQVTWTPPAWTATGQTGPAQRATGLAPIIQQIIDQPGWASGNALVLLFKGTGRRAAESFEGQAAGAALLHIEYR
jgi:uncharacterized protein YjiK